MIMSNRAQPIVDRAQLALPSWKVRDELLARFSEFNDAVDELLCRARDCEEASPVDGDASTLTIEEIRGHRRERQDDSLKIAQGLVGLFEQRANLLAAAMADLADAAARAEKSLDSAKAKVRQQLTKMGLGVEVSQAWPSNHRSAAIEFDHRVAKSTIVGDAHAEFCDLSNGLKNASQYAVNNERDSAAARARLGELVSELVSS